VSRIGHWVVALSLLPGILLAGGDANGPCRPQLDVRSTRLGNLVRVDVRLELAVPIAVGWETMTDYSHAGRFIRNLRRSEAVALAPDRQLVKQLGWVGWAGVGAEIRTDYEVLLEPARWRLVGTLIAGDARAMDMRASLSSPGAGHTVLDYVVTTDPGPWVPAALAEGMLRHHARASFEDLAAEMQRRAAPCLDLDKIPEKSS